MKIFNYLVKLVSLPDRWDFGKKSVKRLKNHKIGEFCFSQPWGINYMWLYLVYNYFLGGSGQFHLLYNWFKLVRRPGGDNALKERFYAEKTSFCTRQFFFFWPSWYVEASEFFYQSAKRGTLRYCAIQYNFLPKSGWDKK